MQIKVSFTSQLKAALGKGDESITLPENATVQDAIDALSKSYVDEFQQFVVTDGRLMPSILTSVNDQQVDCSAELQDGDNLILLSAISGG